MFQARKRGETIPFRGWKAYVPFMASTGSSSSTNYPTPRSSGPIDWIKDKISTLSNKRQRSGGYEDTRNDGAYQGLNSGNDRGRTRGVEDDAWDSRVGGRDDDPYGAGPGGYNEEAELGLAPTPGVSGAYSGGDYMGSDTGYGGGRGRMTDRDSTGSHLDPFADSNAAASLRSISPRPDLGVNTAGHRRIESEEAGNTSPISTRKSVFREEVN